MDKSELAEWMAYVSRKIEVTQNAQGPVANLSPDAKQKLKARIEKLDLTKEKKDELYKNIVKSGYKIYDEQFKQRRAELQSRVYRDVTAAATRAAIAAPIALAMQSKVNPFAPKPTTHNYQQVSAYASTAAAQQQAQHIMQKAKETARNLYKPRGGSATRRRKLTRRK